MKNRYLRILGPLVILVIFLAAAWFLYGKVKGHSYEELRTKVQSIRTVWILVAIGLTVLNYIILVAYDLLAVRYIGERLALWKIALASFTGYAFSYNLTATLGGTSVRFRLYSAWGLPVAKIVQLLVILGLTIWFGLFALAGVLFLCDPLQVPDNPYIPSYSMRIVGAVLLGMAVIYVGLAACHKGTVRIWRWQLPVPPFKLTLYQIGVASADMLVAASVLYALVPCMTGAGIDYPRFISIYMLAYVAAVLIHMPGGYGVFDGIIIVFLGPENEAAAIAALLVFRIIYYWVPLLIAALLLGGYEVFLHKHWLAKAADAMCACGRRRLDQPPPDASQEVPEDCTCRGTDATNERPRRP